MINEAAFISTATPGLKRYASGLPAHKQGLFHHALHVGSVPAHGLHESEDTHGSLTRPRSALRLVQKDQQGLTMAEHLAGAPSNSWPECFSGGGPAASRRPKLLPSGHNPCCRSGSSQVRWSCERRRACGLRRLCPPRSRAAGPAHSSHPGQRAPRSLSRSGTVHNRGTRSGQPATPACPNRSPGGRGLHTPKAAAENSLRTRAHRRG